MARSITINGVPFSVGNTKLRDTTAIFNMNSATDCPALKLGLCQCAEKCYAKKSERMYKQVLPFRQRQEKAFATKDEYQIAFSILAGGTKKTPIKEFRFSEAGDFVDQRAVDKMTAICIILKENGITCYGYTTRKDLDLSKLMEVATVQGSGFMANNEFRYIPKGESIGDCNYTCAGDCRICSACWTCVGLTIACPQH